jgi:hypothetical protein
MKPNLLEQIIKAALQEQKLKKVFIKQMQQSKRNQVVANGGVTGFEVHMKFDRDHGDLSVITKNIRTYILADPRTGANSRFNITDSVATNQPRYMYVIGDDVRKSKRHALLNIWVIAYSPLAELAKKIDNSNKNDRYQVQLKSVVEYYIANIPTYTWSDAAKWIAVLKMQATKFKLELFDPQLDKKVEFPNLSTINKPETSGPDVATKIVKIDDTNREDYESISTFTGEVEISYDSYGNEQATYINGSLPVFRDNDGMQGVYTGTWENGMPANGVAIWNDAEKWEGRLQSTKTVDPNTGEQSFKFSSAGAKITKSKSTNPETSRLEYPYTITDGSAAVRIIYTMSDTDKWVYVKVNDEWYTTNKIDFERQQLDGGPRPNSKVIPKTETDVYAKLDALVVKTPGAPTTNNSSNTDQPTTNNSDQSVDTKNTKDNKPLVQPLVQREKPETVKTVKTVKTDKNKTTVEFLNKEKSKNRNGIAFIKVSKTPIYFYKNKQWVKAGTYNPKDGQYIAYLGNSSDYKYIRVKFVKDNKVYWIPTSFVK